MCESDFVLLEVIVLMCTNCLLSDIVTILYLIQYHVMLCVNMYIEMCSTKRMVNDGNVNKNKYYAQTRKKVFCYVSDYT